MNELDIETRVGLVLIIFALVAVSAIFITCFADAQTARTCREKLAALSTSRSAADIAAICK